MAYWTIKRSSLQRSNLNPMLRCGLVFSGANRAWSGKKAFTSRDDGMLTGSEISALHLSKVSLATLSACETGLGKIADYDGIFVYKGL